jgi:2,4-dienoyl-CoA reductase-like NADH-dependent reductase (Old Yellow Enzyme family)
LDNLGILYTPCAVGRRVAPNRWVSQPMEGCDADSGGVPSERTLQRYERLAEGQWGIVVVEATSVTPLALGRLQGLILTPETAARHAELVRRFKARNTQALLWLQLTHSGPNSHPSTDPTTVNPTSQRGLRYLATDEIEAIRREAVRTALLAEQIGYDGIDLKTCNGYLGADLLRPTNTRADRWGGSFQNRSRFFVEAFAEIKAGRRSEGFLLGLRMHWAERRVGGLGTAGPGSTTYDPTESLELIRLLDCLGLDYVNITGEVTDLSGYADLEAEEQRVPALLAERLAKTLVRDERLGLAVIGSSYSALGQELPAIAARRLRAGFTDLVGLGRGSLADPLLPAHLRAGEPAHYCVDCGGCVRLMLAQRHSGCAARDPYYRELYRALRREEK